jgi:hypothetical protein
MITGANTTASDTSHSSNGLIEGGSYTIDYPSTMRGKYGTSNAGAAIWINGLGKPGSGASNIKINEPVIHLTGDTTTAIKVSGAGANVTIVGPIISGTARNSAIIVGPDRGGRPHRTIIVGAQFRDVEVGNHPLVSLDGDDDTITGSVITGGTFSTPVRYGQLSRAKK